jgi:hypothetical protein
MGFETGNLGYRSSHEGRSTLAIMQLTSAAASLLISAAALLVTHGHESYSEQGVVHLGANGREYVLPQGAQRPVYASLGACVTDVTAQLGKIEKATGQKAKETPQELCQPVAAYQGAGHRIYYPNRDYYGPIVNPDSVWKSRAIATWQTTIPDGTFAASGTHIQASVHLAPSGLRPGVKTTITDPEGGGFGEHGSSGFTENGGSVEPHGGGGGIEEPHVRIPVIHVE